MRACLFFIFLSLGSFDLDEGRGRERPIRRRLKFCLTYLVSACTIYPGRLAPWSPCDDDARFSVGFADRAEEPATIQAEVPSDSRDRSENKDDAVAAQFERDSRRRLNHFPGSSRGFGHDPCRCGGRPVCRRAGPVL